MLTWADTQLADQREANARGYARAAALIELRGQLVEWAHDREQTYLTPQEMAASPADEEEHARLGALIDVIVPKPQEEYHA